MGEHRVLTLRNDSWAERVLKHLCEVGQRGLVLAARITLDCLLVDAFSRMPSGGPAQSRTSNRIAWIDQLGVPKAPVNRL